MGAPGMERWWAGSQWTDHTRFAPQPALLSVPGDPYLAGYGTRLGGYLIDGLLLNAISLLLLVPFGGAFHVTSISDRASTGHLTILGGTGLGILVQIGLFLIYGTLFIGSRRGQTLGMRAVGIRCVRVDGARLGYGKALWRAVVEQCLLLALLIPWIIDMLFPLWDRRNQTIHDKAVDCLVVKGSRGT
jgi:uncharacterized RDD family membrane protein YckC